MTLRIAVDLELPDDVATETTAILARRGRGKTYTASVVAEELAAAGQPFVVLDPTGAWWGLRSSANGTEPGLEVTILGGEHGDVPLEATAGKVIASFVVDNPGAYVLDLSSFESNAAQDRFVTAFAERLYRAKANDRTPLTLIVDEADSFAPQRAMPGQQAMLGAFEAIVRRGRIRGLGCILITQRPAVLNKNVLTQAGVLVVLGITAKLDRDAIDDWVRGHATDEERRAVMSSLAGFGVGEAWVWWPTEDILQRVQIRARRTFDSSATPKAGERVGPVAFADVDLDELKEAIADTIEKAQADDPAILRQRIKDLERELRTRPVETVTETLEVPVVPSLLAAAIDGTVGTLRDLADRLERAKDDTPTVTIRRPRDSTPIRATVRPARPPASVDISEAAPPPAPRAGDHGLGGGVPAKILAALAQHDQLTKRRIAALVGVKQKASTLRNALSRLRTLGYIDGSDPVRITDTGRAAAGEAATDLPTGADLLAHWRAKLGDGAPRRIFDLLADAWPAEVDAQTIADELGIDPATSTLRNAMSRLRSLGLADGWKLDDDLAAAIQ